MIISRLGRSDSAPLVRPDALREPSPQSRPHAESAIARVSRDERGAILVMGIFICSCVAGMLWYLAGIGDAIVFRERLQTGADAAALSAAVLHIKGMHLIVTLNYIMACILAIRVALRLAVAVLVIVGTAFTATILLAPAGQACFGVAAYVEQIVQNTWQPINRAIGAINTAQGVIARIVPPAAMKGSWDVGKRYRPIVDQTVSANPKTLAAGLPVDNGSEDKLCQEAGEAVIDLLFLLPGMDALSSDTVRDRLSSVAGKVVRTGGAYFCGIGSGGPPPDFGEEIGNSANDNCRAEENKRRDAAREAAGNYWSRCNSFDPNCTLNGGSNTLTEEQLTELRPLQAEKQRTQAELDAFDFDDCKDAKKAEMEQKVSASMAAGQNSSGGGSGGQTLKPKRVHSDWKNGVSSAQILTLATANTDLLSVSPRLVRLGSWDRNVGIREPGSSRYAVAQAEFFYDCSGGWDTDDCNGPSEGDSDAMWNYRWRARMRRFSAGGAGSGVQSLVGAVNAAEWLSIAVQEYEPSASTLQSAELVLELGRAVTDPDNLIIH